MSAESYTRKRLVELLQRKEVVVYLGPDLPQSLTGVPGWPTLAARLSGQSGQTWPDAAAQFVRRYGKQELVDWLEEQFRGREPGPIHWALAALPVDKFIAATYDDLLQKSIESTAADPNSVVTAEDLNFVRGGRQTVVKLLGEVSPGRRGSLLLTDNEIRGLTTYRRALLEQEVRPTLTRSNLLILGQDLHTDFFQDLYFGSLPQSGQLRRRAFAVWSGLEDWEKESWKEGNLTVVEADPLELIDRLLQMLQLEPAEPGEENVPELEETPDSHEKPRSGKRDTLKTPDDLGTTKQDDAALDDGRQTPTPEPLTRQLTATLAALGGIFLVIVVAFTYLASNVANGLSLALTIVGVVLVLFLVLVAAFVAVRLFSPDAGERLFTSVIEALPLIGRIAGVPHQQREGEEDGGDSGGN